MGWSVKKPKRGARPHRRKPAGVRLTEEQMVLAAKAFTVSNLGQDQSKDRQDAEAVERSYQRCRMAFASEGLETTEEYNDWLMRLRARDRTVTRMAVEALPWLPEYAAPVPKAHNEYLPDATNFLGLHKTPRAGLLASLRPPVRCPRCKGYGKWNLKLHAYGKDKHFRACCGQCNGWGWVRKGSKDETCIHQWEEISAEEARKRGLQHFGMCWHVYVCRKCGQTTATDSSD